MQTAVSGRPDQLDDCADTLEPLWVGHLSKMWVSTSSRFCKSDHTARLDRSSRLFVVSGRGRSAPDWDWKRQRVIAPPALRQGRR